jgi:hypothetical protein
MERRPHFADASTFFEWNITMPIAKRIQPGFHFEQQVEKVACEVEYESQEERLYQILFHRLSEME